jgi:hypothetical protein
MPLGLARSQSVREMRSARSVNFTISSSGHQEVGIRSPQAWGKMMTCPRVSMYGVTLYRSSSGHSEVPWPTVSHTSSPGWPGLTGNSRYTGFLLGASSQLMLAVGGPLFTAGAVLAILGEVRGRGQPN